MTNYTIDEKSNAVLEYLKGEKSHKSIAQERNVGLSPLKRWVARYLKHGMEGLVSSYTNYTLPFKLEVLKYMNEYGASINETALHYNLPSDSTLLNWANQFKEGGIDTLKPKKKGRLSMKKETKKKSLANGSQEALLAKLEYLRAEIAYLKKLNALVQEKEALQRKKKRKVVHELRKQFDFNLLLSISKMARSTYYYWVNAFGREDKYTEIKSLIKEIFHTHKGRYGYRRITLELRNRGARINHKTVLRLMNELGLKSLVRMKKYRSYKGNIGKIAPNILARDFKAAKSNEKWVTDVTEFHLAGEKLYLSAILDLFNGEIIAYNIVSRPVYPLVSKMLDKAFNRLESKDSPILHSDQGWHYQMKQYFEKT